MVSYKVPRCAAKMPAFIALALGLALSTTNALKLSNVRSQWSPALRNNAAPSPRSGAASASDPESGAWLFGGYDGSDALDDLWHFDPRAGGRGEAVKWRRVDATGPRPGPRLCSAGAVAGGEFFVLGGWDWSTKRDLDDVWAYDVSGGGGGWRRVGEMPAPSKNHVAVALDGKVVVHGPSDASVLVLEDGALREVATSGDGPGARTMHAAAPAGGDLFVFGGVRGGGERDDAYVLDLETYRWRPVGAGAGPGPRVGATASTAPAAPRFPLVYGGARKTGGALAPLGDLWALDVEGGEWRRLLGEDDDAPPPRNAASLEALDGTTLLLTNGWAPFAETFSDAYRLEIDPGE